MKQWGHYLINTSDILRYAWCVRCYRCHCIITEAIGLFSDKEIWIIQLWNNETIAWLILGMSCNMRRIFNVTNAFEWRQLLTPLMAMRMVPFASMRWYPSNETSLFISLSVSPFPHFNFSNVMIFVPRCKVLFHLICRNYWAPICRRYVCPDVTN